MISETAFVRKRRFLNFLSKGTNRGMAIPEDSIVRVSQTNDGFILDVKEHSSQIRTTEIQAKNTHDMNYEKCVEFLNKPD